MGDQVREQAWLFHHALLYSSLISIFASITVVYSDGDIIIIIIIGFLV